MTRWYQPAWVNRELIPTTPIDLGQVRKLLTDAVVKRLMSDVPWGVLLSGGLDSSLIASIASRHVRASLFALLLPFTNGFRAPHD